MLSFIKKITMDWIQMNIEGFTRLSKRQLDGFWYLAITWSLPAVVIYNFFF